MRELPYAVSYVRLVREPDLYGSVTPGELFCKVCRIANEDADLL